ncbi:MAG: C10 family peptidase, partial [Planctomycetota bacterium]
MDTMKQPWNSQLQKHCLCLELILVGTFLFWHSADSWAGPVSQGDAEKVVRGWLKHNHEPLGAQVGTHIKETEVYTNTIGEAMYYIVYLHPEGFVVVPADGRVEPIIALVAHGTYAPSRDNPLGALVSRDVPGRIAAVRALQAKQKGHPQNNDLAKWQTALQEAASRAGRKWAKLQSYDKMVTTTGIPVVSDVRVAPLVQTEWAQTGLWLFPGGEPEYFPIYDYYTPGPYYPCGCVATAMAQLMRYHEHPTGDVGTPSFTIYVDGSPQTASLRGGDGAGGAYHWSDMVFDPNVYTPEEQRQAIGALCYDAGVAVEMSYTSGGSSSAAFMISGALTGPFDYSSAIYGDVRMDLGLDELMEMMNPNLDASLPVLLTVWGRATTGAFHEVVCDGYGYDNSTLYHHLNMGWRGNDNAWYALPEVGTEYEFNSITDCTYNIFTSDSGEIISGRVTDAGGAPLDQATVIAHAFGGQTYLATTNEKGIYALRVPSNPLFFAQAVRSGWRFDHCEVRTGTSVDKCWASGNLWGIDFSGAASEGLVDLERQAYLTGEVVTIRVVDADLQGIGTEP